MKSHCSFQRWFRWYQWFLKILIIKGTCPTVYFENAWCDFSALERAHGLKFRMKVLFLMPNTMTPTFFKCSKILVNLGISSETHHITLSSSSHISTNGRSKWWRWWLKILCFKYIWVITSNYENIFDSTENLIYISRGHFDELSDKLKFDLVTNSHLVLVLSSSSPRPEVSNKGSFELLKFMFCLFVLPTVKHYYAV